MSWVRVNEICMRDEINFTTDNDDRNGDDNIRCA